MNNDNVSFPVPAVTARDILDGFRMLGVRPGDRFVMHSSLKSLGHVEGGAGTVVEAALRSVAPGGTVFMPAMTFGAPFDLRVTPSKCGAVTEALRLHEGSVRSLSPTHSIVGLGPDASRLLDGHDRDFPFGPNGFGTPLDRLANEGGYIVLLGVNHRSNTIAHLIWYRAGIPLFEEWREVPVTGADGSTGIVRVRHPGCSLGFNRLDPILDDHGIQRKLIIGAATVRWMKADNMIEAGLDAVKRDPFLLLCDTPDCRFCRYAEKMLVSS